MLSPVAALHKSTAQQTNTVVELSNRMPGYREAFALAQLKRTAEPGGDTPS